MKRYDVIILGGGPAGAATALALVDRGYAVLLIERTAYEHWRVGETLPPHAQKPLRALGIWERFLQSGHMSSPAIAAAWGGPHLYETSFIFNPYGSGWHLDRKRFDTMLALAAEAAGATVFRSGRVTTAAYGPTGWHLLVEGRENSLSLESSFLVDATGRSSWLARSQGSKRISYDTMIGLIGVLTTESTSQSIDPILQLEAIEEGWWYSAPVPDRSLVVTYITDRDYLAASHQHPTHFWHSKLEHTIHTAARAREFQIKGVVSIKSASTYRLERPAGDSWLAVGDAAGTYDPLSAEGVNKALRSGLTASQTIHDYLKGNRWALDEYTARVSREFEDYLEQRMQYYQREERWSDSLFWGRRRMSVVPVGVKKPFR